jgi:hypothetical protein
VATPRDNRNIPRVVVEKPDFPKVSLYSHNWCDPTTWYEAAVRVVDEVAADQGTHTTYALAHTNVIDTYHGKITQEDFLTDASDHSYRVVVKVDGVTKTEQDPHLGSGGDYTIDYAAGTVTFLAALAPTAVVTVTYHYATSSLFTLRPDPGKRLVLDFVEAQFAEDVVLTDSVTFQPYGYVIAFAPHLAQSNGGAYPDTMKIPLGNPLVYKGFRDFFNDAVKSYTAYPALGGTNWRAMPVAVNVFDWDYVRATAISSAAGMEIRVALQHDIPFEGTYATATFYCASEPEAWP